MNFNEGEKLTIENPGYIKEFENHLIIEKADKIHWTWYSYGNPKTEENLFFIEIKKSEKQLNGISNVNWHIPDFKDLSLKKPALLWT